MKNSGDINRRQFVGGVTAAASATFLAPNIARGQENKRKIRLGVIGCGGRGNFVTGLFAKNGGYEIVAAADYFDDRLKTLGDKFQVPENCRYNTLMGYKKLIEQKNVEAIAIISPPYFHPEQAAMAIDAGKHAYVAKPVAVDVPGCNSIATTGKKATGKKLCFLVDFQTRCDQFYIEAVKRAHEGGIGDYAFGESMYHCNRLQTKTKPDGSQEARLRNWVFDKALSGDIITEQNVHTLDVMSWIMNEEPISATGSGGRKVRVDVGDCWDHFALVFKYSNNVGVTFTSRQFNGYDVAPSGIRNKMFGSKGVLESQYGGTVMIRGKKTYRGGRTSAIYRDGPTANIATFYKNITEGDFSNPTVAPSVRSNLVTILGREAAYTGEEKTWKEIIKSTAVLDPKLKGLKS